MEVSGLTARLASGGASDLFLRDHLAHALSRATRIDVVVAFAQPAGVALLRSWLVAACGRGASVRVLVSDYLSITHPRALRGLMDLEDAVDAAGQGALCARVLERAAWSRLGSSFHAKGWIFEAEGFGRAWVGSSNLSFAALHGGLEWNLRLDRGDDPQGFAQLCSAFEALWTQGRALDEAWVAAYEAARARVPEANLEAEQLDEPPAPHAIQREALDALAMSRAAGHARALVVMATGLGKTWLAAMDALASGAGRVLFIAHRVELLEQAARVMRRAMPDATQGWVAGGRARGAGAQVVLASVAALSRSDALAQLSVTRFDYVIIDEAHHAPATSYQRVLGALDAGFVLGLTATPERLDVASVAGVFHDHIAYRADLARGLREGLLAGVRYWGLRDVVDMGALRFGARRFDEAALEEALLAAHDARMERVWEAWQAHPGRRSLVFCQSVTHAEAVCSWLRGAGVRVAAVWAGAGSADRQEALLKLESGELDAICAVDLFNEGVDAPAIDRVVMLRPTESPIIFLQQLGRGLRRCEGKEALVVLDMVGNHRVFIERFYSLFGALGADSLDPCAAVLAGESAWNGPGWSVTLELEAVDVLRELLAPARRMTRRGAAWQLYEEALARRGVRPRAAELYRLGGLGGASGDDLRGGRTWFEALAEAGQLEPEREAALGEAQAARWLRELERGGYNKSFKLIVLRALLDADALWTGLEIEALCARCYTIMRGDPALWAEIHDAKLRELPRVLSAAQAALWAAYWRKWPLDVWTGQELRQRKGQRGSGGWFCYDEQGRFAPTFEVAPERREAVAQMTDELVEFLLARRHG